VAVDPATRVRLTLANDFDLVVAGLSVLLAPFHDRIEIVDWVLVGEDPPERPADVLLYDTYGRYALGLDDVEELTANPLARHVIVYTWETSPELIERTLAMGVSGFASKALGAEELVSVIERVAAGERVVATPGRHARVIADWPGRTAGLTARESEILALVIQGFRNDDIAQALFLGVNTVKTHLKSLYRKIGARNRAEAVAIAMSEQAFANRVKPGRLRMARVLPPNP
jgi:DNA-binding NarL/FixJ family response regulator